MSGAITTTVDRKESADELYERCCYRTERDVQTRKRLGALCGC